MAKKKATSAGRTKRRTPKPQKQASSQAKPKGRVTASKRPGAGKLAVDPGTIRLVEGKGGPDRGGGHGGHYWHIYVGDTRAGHVYINVIDEQPFGKHASIQIQVNKNLHGRGIGRAAYRMACDQSSHDVVFAHMRKSNLASQRAALAAGFEVIKDPAVTQLAMRWTRRP